MSKAINSPTARILRSSRLFCMPPPLPPPNMEKPVGDLFRLSDTATHPYPSRQAIATTPASRHRGDWGLKRPLPRKTTSTSTPHVRIHALDNWAHITDFESAADHTVSLQKFLDMGIPMKQTPIARTGSGYHSSLPSAFDGSYDHTAIRDNSPSGKPATNVNDEPVGYRRAMRTRKLGRDASARWRTLGPHLPTLSQVDFERYLRLEVGKPETASGFRKFLMFVRKHDKRQAVIESMRLQGQGYDPNSVEDQQYLAKAAAIKNPHEDLEQFILRLRATNDTLSSQLSRLVGEFFDLAPFPEPKPVSDSKHQAILDSFGTSSLPGVISAPSHPSAGLSYTKTRSIMANHPLHGPQQEQAPVTARLLRPRHTTTGSFERAIVGVSGFAALDSAASGQRTTDTSSNSHKWDFDNDSAHRFWVEPFQAYVDSNGQVNVSLRQQYPDKEAIAVKTGGADPRPSQGGVSDKSFREQMKRIPWEDDPFGVGDNGQQANFGSQIPSWRTASKVEPLDENLTKDIRQDFVRKLKQTKWDGNDPHITASMRMLMGGR